MTVVQSVAAGVLAGALLVLVLLGLWGPTSAPVQSLAAGPTRVLPAGSVFTAPQALQSFSLVDQHGQRFDLLRLKGQWTFMFFGFTHCPDVCPGTMLVYKQMHQQLTQVLGPLSDVEFVFVSVDPKRDTPELLGGYVTYFHRDFLGVTGPERALRDLTQQLGVFYRLVDRPGEEYFVEHSGSILLLDPEARLVALFPAPHRAKALVETYLILRDGRPT